MILNVGTKRWYEFLTMNLTSNTMAARVVHLLDAHGALHNSHDKQARVARQAYFVQRNINARGVCHHAAVFMPFRLI